MINYQYENVQILQVKGVDTKKFLQGLTTADLNLLNNDNDLLFTAFANLKGRIISLCFVKYIDEGTLLLSVNEGVVEGLLTWLKKYGMFSKVSFEINNEYSLVYNETGFLAHDIVRKNQQSNISFEEVQKLNIINKLAFINADNFEKLLPAELELDNLENVVCYTKGCYMGQEVIARMHYKAKLKKELAVVKAATNIQAFDLKNADGKPLAAVVNKVFLAGECYMLVVFHKEANEREYKLESGEIITKC